MTHEPMTAERLQEIRARHEAATPGPWAYEAHGDSGDYGVGVIMDGNDNYIEGYNDDNDCLLVEVVAIEVKNIVDADFIAHAHVDIPALLDEVERLNAELAEIRKNSIVIPQSPPKSLGISEAEWEEFKRTTKWILGG